MRDPGYRDLAESFYEDMAPEVGRRGTEVVYGLP
jgi:hypothetical protein